jgi:hypothetical protein
MGIKLILSQIYIIVTKLIKVFNYHLLTFLISKAKFVYSQKRIILFYKTYI